MNFPELFDATVVLTNRPDLVNETILAIQKATQHLHNLDFWHKDFNQRVLALPSNTNTVGLYTFQIDIKARMPRFRKMGFARKWDLVGVAPGEFFTVVKPEDILDTYKINKPNRYYVGGNVLNFLSTTVDTAVLVGYYSHPLIQPITDYQSWIADEYSYAIVVEASSRVNAMIGKLDEAAAQQKEMNSSDPMNPGWIQKIYAGNLVDEAQ